MCIVTVKNADLYSKPDGISRFVSRATKYASKIQLTCNTMQANAKSIMGVAYFFRASEGEAVTIIAEGSDESEAVDELSNFLS